MKRWIALVALITIVGLGAFIGILAPIPEHREPSLEERLKKFQGLPMRAAPLVAAIEKFAKDTGKPPNNLSELVPKYIASIPETGVGQFPSYSYRAIPDGGMGPVIWYDLGPVGEGPLPTDDAYDARLGDSEHAILVFRFLDGRLSTCHAVRFGPSNGIRFDSGQWRADKMIRRQMVRDFQKNTFPKIEVRENLLELLGEPDGRGFLAETPWELSVECTWDNANMDSVVYWPTRNYPHDPKRFIPIGDWRFIPGSDK